MALREQIAADAAIFFDEDEFAELVTYGGIENVLAVVQLGQNMEKGNPFSARGQSITATIMVRESEVPSPAGGDVIQRASAIPAALQSWRVARVLSSAGGIHRLECTASESPWSA